MRAVRRFTGGGSILAFIVCLNFVLLEQDPSSWRVWSPFMLGLALALAWSVLLVVEFVSGTGGRSIQQVNMAVSTLLFLGICIALYAFVTHGDWAWDLSQEGRRDLSPQTVQVLESVRDEVRVIFAYTPAADREVQLGREKTRRFLEKAREVSPLLTIEYLDAQQDVPRLQAEGITRVSPLGTVVLKSGVRPPVTILMKGDSPRLSEREFTSALIKVARDARPRICFLTGHGERDIENKDPATGANVLKRLLDGEGYQTEKLAIDIARPLVPPDYEVLIVNGPRADLHGLEVAAIKSFIDAGGRVLMLLDLPARQRGNAAESDLAMLLRDEYGIELGENLLIQAVEARPGWITLVPDTSAVQMFANYDVDAETFEGCYNKNHFITRGFALQMNLLTVRTVSSVEAPPANVIESVELLRTLPFVWAETDLAAMAAGRQIAQDADEPTKSYPVAVAVTVKTDVPTGEGEQTRDGRLVVVGDSDFVADESLNTGGNVNFILDTLAWLSEQPELAGIRPPTETDEPLLLTDSQEKWIAWVASLAVLQAVIAAGFAMFMWRRRYQ